MKENLATAVQSHLQRLLELVCAEGVAVTCGSTEAYSVIDKEIERVIGEKQRSLDALKQHQEAHGC